MRGYEILSTDDVRAALDQEATKQLMGCDDNSCLAELAAALDAAVDGCLAGRFDAMVTAPVHKGVINDAGFAFTGHTEYLADHSGPPRVVMMLAGGRVVDQGTIQAFPFWARFLSHTCERRFDDDGQATSWPA